MACVSVVACIYFADRCPDDTRRMRCGRVDSRESYLARNTSGDVFQVRSMCCIRGRARARARGGGHALAQHRCSSCFSVFDDGGPLATAAHFPGIFPKK